MDFTKNIPEKIGVRVILTDLLDNDEEGQCIILERIVDQSLYADVSVVDALVDSLRGFGFDDVVIVRAFEEAIVRLSE
jgi:hypothetical protein